MVTNTNCLVDRGSFTSVPAPVVHDGEPTEDRMVRRATLELEHLLHGRRVGRVGAQPVDSLSRKNHQFSAPDSIRGRTNRNGMRTTLERIKAEVE